MTENATGTQRPEPLPDRTVGYRIWEHDGSWWGFVTSDPEDPALTGHVREAYSEDALRTLLAQEAGHFRRDYQAAQARRAEQIAEIEAQEAEVARKNAAWDAQASGEFVPC